MKKMFKVLSVASVGAIAGLGLASCNINASSSATATKDNPFKIKLAHNLGPEHAVSKAIEIFAKDVLEKTNGRVLFNISDNGKLPGGESGYLEMIKEGSLGATKVASGGLASYDETYHAFGLPYVFNSEDEYKDVMNSKEMRNIFLRSKDKGFVTLTWYTSGIRSMYGKHDITSPDDIKGKTYRVQNMATQTAMLSAWGGNPNTMSVTDVYSALSTGQLEGAESNETVLTLGNHGELCKYFVYTEHCMIPDAFVMSTKIWDKISESDQQIILDSALMSTGEHQKLWDESIEKAKKESVEKYGTVFHYLTKEEKQVFIDKTQSVRDDFAKKYPKIQDVLDIVNAKRGL